MVTIINPSFPSHRARNEAYTRIIRSLPLCNTIDAVWAFKRECAHDIMKIRQFDIENPNSAASVYPLLVEQFNARIAELTQGENHGYDCI